MAYPPPAHAARHQAAAQRHHRSRAALRATDPGCMSIGPAMRVSKRDASAGKHGEEGVEEERAPGRMQRGALAMESSDGARVRAAAMDLDSLREEVEHRDPHRGIEPRRMA